MNKVKKEKTITDKKYLRIILSIFSLFFVVLSLWIIIDCFDTKKITKKHIASYNVEKGVKYRVYYKENQYFDEIYMGMDNKYLSSLIEKIDIDFSYVMSTSKLINANYEYSVDVTLVNNYMNNNKASEIWKKTDIIVPNINQTLNRTTVMDVRETLVIDYPRYNNAALDFKTKFGINTEAFLLVKLNMVNKSRLLGDNTNINDESVLELKIPLMQNVISITKNTGENVNNSIYKDEILDENMNYALIVMALVILSFTLPLSIISIARLFVITNMEQYMVLKKKYLKNYGDIIASVSTKPNLKGVEIINVTNFQDLVDIEEELRIPILFYEVIKEKESWYMIIDNNKMYRYILKSNIDDKSLIAKKIDKYDE